MSKNSLFYTVAVISMLLMVGCSLDNYEEPSSILTGKVAFNGNSVGLSHGKVSFNLYQEGYGKRGPIPVYLAYDGSFSAMLFDGAYRLEIIDNNGPWNNDIQPMDIIVNGDTDIEIDVTPYYFLTDVSIVLNGNEVRSLCNVREVSPERKLRQLFLCVGPTRFISDQSYSYVARRNLMPVNLGGNSISVDISDIISEYDMLYARLGLQMEGLQECIYSDVIRIK